MATGLSFTLCECSDVNVGALETAFLEYRANQSLEIDKLLGSVYGGVHLLVAFALVGSAVPRLAVVAFLTTAQQLGSTILASQWPKTYVQWRFPIYAFNILWSSMGGNLITKDFNFSPCTTAGSAVFFVSEIVNTSGPWLVLHALVYPLPAPLAIVINGVASLAIMVTNFRRCHSSMSVCPMGTPYLEKVYEWMRSVSGVFSATHDIPRAANFLETGAAAGAGAGQVMPFGACAAVYAVIQLFLFVVSMHSLWLNEYGSRLEFLAETDAVDVEWWLESRQRPKITERIARGVELVASVVILASIFTALVPEVLRWEHVLIGR